MSITLFSKSETLLNTIEEPINKCNEIYNIINNDNRIHIKFSLREILRRIVDWENTTSDDIVTDLLRWDNSIIIEDDIKKMIKEILFYQKIIDETIKLCYNQYELKYEFTKNKRFLDFYLIYKIKIISNTNITFCLLCNKYNDMLNNEPLYEIKYKGNPIENIFKANPNDVTDLFNGHYIYIHESMICLMDDKLYNDLIETINKH